MSLHYALELGQYRQQVQHAVEDQRAGRLPFAAGSAAAPYVEVHAALQAIFALLALDAEITRLGSGEQALCFEILSMAAQLDHIEFSLDDQIRFAQAVFDFWACSVPSIHCRALLNILLARRAGRSHFVMSMSKLLQENFVPGNKRSLHILAMIFDVLEDNHIENCFPDLWDKLVESLSEQSGSLQAGKVLLKLAIRRHGNDADQLAQQLFTLLLEESHCARQTVYETLLPPLLTSVPGLVDALIVRLIPLLDSLNGLSAYLSLLRIALSASAVINLNQPAIMDVICDSVVHAVPSIRFEALRLLVTLSCGNAASRRIPGEHFNVYRTFWTHSMGDSDSAATRTSLIGTWKDFLVQCRISSYAASRDAKKFDKLGKAGKSEAIQEFFEAKDYVEAVEGFLRWWLKLAMTQLHPAKPYRCQANALLFLEVLLHSGVDSSYVKLPSERKSKSKAKTKSTPIWAFEIQVISDAAAATKLLACITSTYDDIQDSALRLLQHCNLTPDQKQSIKKLAFTFIMGKRDSEIASGILLLRLRYREQSSEETSNMNVHRGR